ncbi:MAG TPA: hypothetical protein VFS00_11890, partial [Polyangiaceae bacterium]|nr:hypothetical protein [Polyangiaceae bacterium]
PSHLRAFRLSDGAMAASFEVPPGGACADIAVAKDGTLYVTDAFRSTIMRLPPNATALEASWCTSPLFAGNDPQNPVKVGGLDVVQRHGRRALFVDKRDTGNLFRIAIVDGPNGEQCAPPVDLQLDAPLPFNDGLRALDFDTVLVTVNAKTPEAVAAGGPIPGALLRVDVSGGRGHVSVVDDTLDQPTGVVIDGKDAWVSEGQILRLIGVDATPPNLPFKLRRVSLR